MTTTADDAGPLLLDRSGAIAVVTLDRPAARNALNAELRRVLYDTMAALDSDESVHVIVLTGTDPAFCAGLDLKELAARPAALSGGFDDASELRRPFPDLSTPLIGAVNGVAITGGFELALLCDFLVASEHARFADTHARVGIMPGWGLTVRLPQAVGIRRAKELSTTGNFLDAATALDWGLINHLVPHEELLPTALKLAADITSNDAAGVREILSIYDDGGRLSPGEALQLEQRRSRDWIEARGSSDLEERRRSVTLRGRDQI